MRPFQTVRLSIGDLTLTLASRRSSCTFHIDSPYLRFLSDRTPEAAYRVHCDGMPGPRPNNQVFDTALGWSLHTQGDLHVVRTRSSSFDPYQVAVFAPDFLSGDIYVQTCEDDPRQSLLPLGYPLGVIVMIHLLAQGRGVLMHASAIDDRGRGYVFAGTGGSGKTTTARLWEARGGARALGDDRIIIRRHDGRFWAYGTPWPGEGGMAVPAEVPIEHVFILRQDTLNRATRLRPAEGAARVLANSFPTYWDAAGMAFTLELLADLSQTIPCSELGFVPDATMVDYVRCLS